MPKTPKTSFDQKWQTVQGDQYNAEQINITHAGGRLLVGVLLALLLAGIIIAVAYFSRTPPVHIIRPKFTTLEMRAPAVLISPATLSPTTPEQYITTRDLGVTVNFDVTNSNTFPLELVGVIATLKASEPWPGDPTTKFPIAFRSVTSESVVAEALVTSQAATVNSTFSAPAASGLRTFAPAATHPVAVRLTTTQNGTYTIVLRLVFKFGKDSCDVETPEFTFGVCEAFDHSSSIPAAVAN